MPSSGSLPKPEFFKNDLIGGIWKVEGELGSGGCGVVYQVASNVVTKSGEKKTIVAAMKAEAIDLDGSYGETLNAEVVVLRRMQWSEHVCRLYAGGRLSPSVNIMIMSMVGRALSWVRKQCPEQKFTLSTAMRIAIQCLHAIQHLHSIGYLHRDVKASNYALGTFPNGLRDVHLLDFGFARAYVKRSADGRMRHRRARRKAPFLGTQRYCSINAHMKLEQGRRDDLWSFLYMIVEMVTGKLPWKSVKGDEAVEMKRAAMTTLLTDCPNEMRLLLDHLLTLQYESAPDYALFDETFTNVCKRKHFPLKAPYDWEKDGVAHEAFLTHLKKAPTVKHLKQRSPKSAYGMEEDSTEDSKTDPNCCKKSDCTCSFREKADSFGKSELKTAKRFKKKDFELRKQLKAMNLYPHASKV